ncbi:MULTISPECIES: heat-inducible transcriptional repressor HrcA [Aestuariimicrobium]|uniref:heat-inducible transcriptional repressor HrcA n=1 Tax=Aestuariimicrobium TaxID=396388 RepID=UPI0003B3833B|nr:MULTISPECIES: heat-inducible transcriptional repressor HrcA [Aestuariimicrobium]CAI9411304.1 Heat-inducible transcription repressor HrcA [Aestuariimicrobium sp. T2.26MG-19.2B]
MDDRKLEVLRAIVTDYVESREPVGSKALVDRHQLNVSPATVRNDMAVLEEEGYITQPHTSAGRIPTDKGYRIFVDRLASIKPLSAAERRAIQTFLSGAVDVDDIVLRTVRLLAQITQQVAIVQYPASNSAIVRHVELVSLTVDRVMVVLITSTGRIEQQVIELPDHDEALLARLREKLNGSIVGLATSQAAQQLTALLADISPDDAMPAAALVATVLELLAVDRASARVAVAGVPYLTRFTDQFESTVKPVLEALEEQVVLLRLLGETVQGHEIGVRIGHENSVEQLRSTSMVASAYGPQASAWASLGVVGPTRMDYPQTMASVSAVARYLGRFLSEG